jgi:hypothetical protein
MLDGAAAKLAEPAACLVEDMMLLADVDQARRSPTRHRRT